MTQKANPVTLTLYSSPEGRHHHPLNLLNLLNLLNPATKWPHSDTATLGAKGPVKLKNSPAVRPVHLKNLLRPRIYGIPYLFSNGLYMVYT